MTTFRFGDFEWDEAKARANLSAEFGDRIRIITARKASPAQRKVYENGP